MMQQEHISSEMNSQHDAAIAEQLAEINRKLDGLAQNVLNCLAAGGTRVEPSDHLSLQQLQQLNWCTADRHANEEVTKPLKTRFASAMLVQACHAPGDANVVQDPSSASEASTTGKGDSTPPEDVSPLETRSATERKRIIPASPRSHVTGIKENILRIFSKDKVNGSARASLITTTLGKQRKRSACSEGIWTFLELPQSSNAARLYHAWLYVFVTGAIILSFCQAFNTMWIPVQEAVILESIVDSFFFGEAFLRFFTCPSFATFLFNPHSIIDVLTALPLLLRASSGFRPLPAEGEARFVRAVLLGLVPGFRLLKILRHSTKFHLLTRACLAASEALPVLLFFYFVLWLFFSTLIYAIEPPESIPDLSHAMWLTVVSMTTVGYGDITPVTWLGRATVGVLVTWSMMYMAIPLGILGSCFSQVWHDRDRHLLGHRVRGALMQHGFTVQDLPGLFETYENRDGEMSFGDFRVMVEKLRLGLDDERIVELYENVDDDNSGAITVEEFIKFLSPSTYWQLYGAEQTTNRLRAVSGDLGSLEDATNDDDEDENSSAG